MGKAILAGLGVFAVYKVGKMALDVEGFDEDAHEKYLAAEETAYQETRALNKIEDRLDDIQKTLDEVSASVRMGVPARYDLGRR